MNASELANEFLSYMNPKPAHKFFAGLHGMTEVEYDEYLESRPDEYWNDHES